MKALHLRPSCVNRIPTLSPPSATHVVAPKLSSGQALVRHRDRTMRTQVRPIGNGFSAWNLRFLWASLVGLAGRGSSDGLTDTRPTGTSGWPERPHVVPKRIAVPAAATLRPDNHGMSATFMDGGNGVSLTAERHLVLVLRSAQHRRGDWWETVGFLAIWLSGLVGVAICVL